MFEKEIVVKNETGLHARPASMLVELCNKYKSEIKIFTEDTEINPKSIISILLGGVYKDTPIRVVVEGEDEEEAGNAICDLINSFEE